MSASDKNSGLRPAKRGAAWGALLAPLKKIVNAEGVQRGAAWGALLARLQEIPDEGVPLEAWGRGLQPGAVIGRFELVQEIGRGRFGVVFEARDRETARRIAFKVVRLVDRTSAREEELVAAARLSHRNIVPIFDIGLCEEGLYIVLELLRGATLAQRLDRGTIPFREALRIAAEVASGLAHTHGQGIVHGHLTPDGVFLCDDGRVVLLEFGLTHALGRSLGRQAWETRGIRPGPGGWGTYAAPELRQGNTGDPRTDVFALGVILFEMLSGDLPFPDDGAKTERGWRPAPRLKLTQETRPGWLARLRHAVRAASSIITGHHAAEDLGDLVARMLEKDPLKRPRSMAQILSALSSLRKAAPRSVSVAVHASAPESQPGGCGAFETTLEEVAFRGQEPVGDLREHLASCPRCADRLQRERALYTMPPELKARVLKEVAREGLLTTTEERVRELLAKGDQREAAVVAIRGLGPEVLRYLRAALRDEADAADAFSHFAEALWRGLPSFRGESSLRTWALRLAANAAANVRTAAWRRRVRRFRTGEASAIADEIRASSAARVEGRAQGLEALRRSLPIEDQSLLNLRLEHRLSWEEIAQLLEELARSPEGEPGQWFGPAVGSSVDQFDILREIGGGGFGVVYEAFDRKSGRAVALKVIRPGPRPLAEARSQCLVREAEAAAQLSHPNIVTLHDLGTSEWGPYLVLEMLHGETLQERLARGALPLAEAVAVGVEVARALAHAHPRGVFHRDLKPSNVFLTEDGGVKVLDFGLASFFGPSGMRGGGTPGYMAPEQWRGEKEDARTDVFGLGVLLFEMLTGRLPYRVERDRSTALDPGPAPAPPGVPPPLEALVTASLSRDPGGRPRDGRAMLDGLVEVQRALTGRETGEASARAAWPGRRRRLIASTAAVALAVPLALYFGGQPLWMIREEARIPVVVVDTSNDTGDPELDSLSGLLIASLQQSQLIAPLTRQQMLDALARAGRSDVKRIDEALGREIARQTQAKALLLISIHRFDDLYAIEMRAIDPSGNEYLFALKEEGTGKSSILGMIDSLSNRLRSGMRQGRPGDVRPAGGDPGPTPPAAR